MIRYFLLTAMMLVCVGVEGAAVPETDEQPLDFQTIAAQLDPGGEFFLVLSAGRWINRTLKALEEGQNGLPAAEPEEQAEREAIGRGRQFMNRMGISAFRGIGCSSVARVDGRHAFKLFLLRDSVDSNLPFWRGAVGWQPRRLLSLDFVPSEFSMVLAGTPEVASLWRVLTDGVQEASTTVNRDRFEGARVMLTQCLGIPPEDLFGSLRDELLLAVRFEKETAKTPLEADEKPASLCPPSFLIVVGTGENVLRGVVEAQLARQKIALTETDVAGVQLRHAQIALNVGPFSWQPAFASPPGFFIFGNSPAIVEEALLACRHRNGLVTRPVFENAFQGLSIVNNGILYVDGDAARALRHAFENRSHTRSGNPALLAVLEFIQAAQRVVGDEPPSGAWVVQNWRHGVMLMGTTRIGGEALLHQAGRAAVFLWKQLWQETITSAPVKEGL